MKTICDVGAVNLVEAIVSMAAHDLEWSLKKKKPGEPEERMQRECERFFRLGLLYPPDGTGWEAGFARAA